MSNNRHIMAFSQALYEKMKSWEKDYVRKTEPTKVGKEIGSVPDEGGKTKLRTMLSIGLRAKRLANSKAGTKDPSLRMLPKEVVRSDRGGVLKKTSFLHGGKALPATGIDKEALQTVHKQELDATSQRQASQHITPSAIGQQVKGRTGAPSLPNTPVAPDVKGTLAREAEKGAPAPFKPGMFAVVGGKGTPGSGTRTQVPGAIRAVRDVSEPNKPLMVVPASGGEKPKTGFEGKSPLRVAWQTTQQKRGWANKDSKRVVTDDPKVKPPDSSFSVRDASGESARVEVPKVNVPSKAKTVSPSRARRANIRAQRFQIAAPITKRPAGAYTVPTSVSKSGRPSQYGGFRIGKPGPENSSIINFSTFLGQYLTEHRYD